MPKGMSVLLILTLGLLPSCAVGPEHGGGEPIEQRDVCDACGEETSPKLDGSVWPDGRISCHTCRQTAVVELAEGRVVLDDARERLDDLLDIDVMLTPVSLVLTDKPGLLASGGKLAHPNLRAFTEITEVIQGEEVVERTFEIQVLTGLPRESLLGILAHELFHVWQALAAGSSPQNQAGRPDPAFREGAANYVQLQVLRDEGAERWARVLIENPDPIYGDGLRRFLALVDEIGEEKALTLGATATGFPE